MEKTSSTLEIMGWFWSKSRTGKVIKDGLNLLDGAIGIGLVSGAAVATAFGKFLLGGLLAVFAFGILARITRRTKSRASSEGKTIPQANFKRRVPMSENVTPVENVARGQKFIIYAILVNFLTFGLQLKFGEIAGLVGIAAIVLSFVGVFRLASGLGYTMGFKILLIVLMLVPLINIITLLVLNSKATKTLRAAGYKVGLLGASAQANA